VDATECGRELGSGGPPGLASAAMSKTRLRTSIGVLAAVGFLLLGACGGDDDDSAQGDDSETGADDRNDSPATDLASLEDELAVNLAEDVNQPTPEVDCPDDVVPGEDEQFECTGTAQDGGQFTIAVTWNDDQGQYNAVVPPE
jgi:hypothetical protein